ncbi:hypothetical protein K438DRAFT_2018469 [Mycena galopus ATCC 62051]|nr:hypothetical protein K438DRAFT_2018469 [Mycena galopus ATCC 62051]
MSHTSPASYLVWGIISVVLFAFLVYHMYSFDRFRCLRWNKGPDSGTFKRIMTYSYLLSVPLIMTYALGFAIIKYRQGFIPFEGGIIPKPYTLWPESERRAIFPLMLTFTFAWSLEMITHLEELCFWFFVVKTTEQRDWFRSRYFRAWMAGSCVAIIYMPLLTILTRADPLRSEAFTFLGGSLGSLTLTLSFTPILWAFPGFLASLKAAGVDTPIIVRITKFHELNQIRVVFRFIFVVPLFILGVDGVRPHKHINESMLWTDFLTMIAAFGCCISSALTLVIFFPRSVEDEIAARDTAREKLYRRSRRPSYTSRHSSNFAPETPMQEWDPSQLNIDDYPLSTASPNGHEPSAYRALPSLDGHPGVVSPIPSPQVAHKEWHYDRARGSQLYQTPATVSRQSSQHHYRHRRPSGAIHPLMHEFTSPIDM